ncbi:hypothetical protein F4604DRAFT_1837607 [Suillus subluteus]|nr:hypothetical protein F4604DRAFT_1837607 [Suillus subluteus]
MNISGPFVESANANAIDTPPGFDEWDSGLTKEKRVQIKASRVKESAFSMECEVISLSNSHLHDYQSS